MLSFFISEGNLTESRIGFDAGPEYGGPWTFSSAMRRGDIPNTSCGLVAGANADTEDNETRVTAAKENRILE